eukprot:s1949_g10.t1
MLHGPLSCGVPRTWGKSENKNTWLETSGYDILSANLAYQYFTSLHWSLTQFTPASMEVTPKNEIERLFNVVVIMSAMVIFSTFISAITNAMNQLRNLNSERNEQASLLRRYMQQNNVSAPLKAREVYAPHVGVHPFFYVCNACFSMQSRKIFSTCLAEKSLTTSQELITSGENATHMYFEPAIALDTGAWLCEAALWVRWQHNGTANTTAQGCELICVDAGGLQNILKDEKPVRQYANMFWKHFSENPEDLSDVWCEEEVLFDWATRAMGQAETYYGDVIPAEPATTSNSKFSQFLQSQRRASSGFPFWWVRLVARLVPRGQRLDDCLRNRKSRKIAVAAVAFLTAMIEPSAFCWQGDTGSTLRCISKMRCVYSSALPPPFFLVFLSDFPTSDLS